MIYRLPAITTLVLMLAFSTQSMAQALTCYCSGSGCVSACVNDIHDDCRLSCMDEGLCDRDPVGFAATFAWGDCPADVTFDTLPANVPEFTYSQEGTAVVLAWSVPSERSNAGYEIERAQETGVFEPVGFVQGPGTSSEARSYSYRIEDLELGTYEFRLKQMNVDGTFKYSSTIEADITLPTKFVLDPAYPNPFNPSTSVRFAVDTEQNVSIALFNAYGQQVRTILEGSVEANAYQTVQVDGSGLATGMYLLQLVGEQFVASQKVVLVK